MLASVRRLCIRDTCIRDICIRDTATRDMCIQDMCTRDTGTRDTRIRDTSGGMDTLAGTDTDTTGVADDMFDHTGVSRGRQGDGHTAAAGMVGEATGADSELAWLGLERRPQTPNDVVNFECGFEPGDDVVDAETPNFLSRARQPHHQTKVLADGRRLRWPVWSTIEW
jgi:hypothetical protein